MSEEWLRVASTLAAELADRVTALERELTNAASARRRAWRTPYRVTALQRELTKAFSGLAEAGAALELIRHGLANAGRPSAPHVLSPETRVALDAVKAAALGGWKNPGGVEQALGDWLHYLSTLDDEEIRAAGQEWGTFVVHHADREA